MRFCAETRVHNDLKRLQMNEEWNTIFSHAFCFPKKNSTKVNFLHSKQRQRNERHAEEPDIPLLTVYETSPPPQ